MMDRSKNNWLAGDAIAAKKSVDFIRGITPVNGTPEHKKLPKRGISVESRASIIKSAFGQLYKNQNTDLLTNYFVGNELHGIKRALTADNRLTQIVWFSIVFFICLAAGNSTRKVVYEFFVEQTATSYVIKHANRLEFPSVIVCPKNPDSLRMSEVEVEVRRHLPQLDNATIRQLIGYAIADAGFTNMGPLLKKMDEIDHEEMAEYLKIWKGNRTTHGFYTNLFERHGYTCDDIFSTCQHGAERIPCCQLFTQHYVMLRGRCFRLDRLFQTDPDYQGRLYLGMNRLPSPLIEKDGIQPQIIAYIADPGTEMATFPRYYLNYHAYNYISVTLRKIDMLPTSSQCYDSDETRGRSACYLRKWLHSRLLEPHNCTLFYMHYRASYAEICEPGVVARDYDDIGSVSMNGTKCLPSCVRSDRRYTLFTSEAKTGRSLYEGEIPDFRLEIGYRDLEYEFYKEFGTTTIPGFISEIGGQFGLFAGVTIITVIQLLLNLVMLIGKQLEKIWKWFSRTSRNPLLE